MSYILDALRKADSERERERGAVPDLHAQPASSRGNPAPDDDERGGPPTLMWAVIGLSVLVTGLLGWMLMGRDTPPPAPAAPPVPPAPALSLQMQPVAPRPSAAPASIVAPPPPVRIDPPPERARALSAVPAVAPAGARPPSRVLSVEELPDDVRRQLPNLMVNGSKYSEAPSSRILIVNGQVFHEGDRLTSELTLEQIQLKEAVLRFRGYRYALRF
ncbi:general secretion pathway protein GspB [Aquabacterium sp.]|uniref:general secretion pathway protein GspB n=1 Tax=Aquabacterium sp. TaxID=1872578 RepID=UPI0035B42101